MQFLNRLFQAYLFIIILVPSAIAQVAPNDSCHNPEIFEIPLNGFGLGSYDTDSFELDSATIQIGEYFHTSLVSSGNDKKSIWFKFYLPTRRGLDIELRQHGSAIQTNDVGFTTYLANSCLPTSVDASNAKITTLNQFGSSFNPCVDPGWYMVQVSSKQRAQGKVFLRIKTTLPITHSAVVDAEYDVKDSAYDFGSAIVGGRFATRGNVEFELGCYTINDSTEYLKDISNNYKEYTQSAWFTFTAGDYADHTQLRLRSKWGCSGDTVGFRLYRGDCKDTTPLVLLDSGYRHWGSGANGSCYSSCQAAIYEQSCFYDSGQTYTVQWLFHKDDARTYRFEIEDYTSVAEYGNTKPVLGYMDSLGVIGNGRWSSYGFSCNSYIKDQNCSSNTMPSTGVKSGVSPFTYNLSSWKYFRLDKLSELRLDAVTYSGYSNSQFPREVMFRLFKVDPNNSCSTLDTNDIISEGRGYGSFYYDCLDTGTYAIQLLGTDSIWQYSSYTCNGPMHLGRDYNLYLAAKALPRKNRFALHEKEAADSVNKLQDLPNYTRVITGRDTISCFNGPQPEEVLDTNLKKTMYRVFKIGDAYGDTTPDSGLLHINGLRRTYTSWTSRKWRSNHQLYKGNALTLRDSQNVTQYPDTLKGLKMYKDGWFNRNDNMSTCIEPGEYTLVSFFDDYGLGNSEQPSVYFYAAKQRFDKPAKAELIDTIKNFRTYYSEYDTFTCTTNPDTIDGYALGLRNSYRVFYHDTTSVLSVGLDWYTYRYTGVTFSVFKGDIRQGRSGLTMYNNNGSDWYKSKRAISIDCEPTQPGWYTVVTHLDTDWQYGDTTFHYGSSRGLYSRHQVTVNTRASNVILPKYNRPYKAAFVDSLVNNNEPLSFDTNYSIYANMPQQAARFTFPTEVLDCALDTPLVSFPKSALCDTTTTDLIYYVFNLEKDAYVGFSMGIPTNWKVKIYNFDVRKDSNLLSTATPLQNCNYDANYLQYCNLQKGVYTMVIMAKRTQGQKVTVTPKMFIDSVVHSRFDFASNAYDFGAIPGDGKYYDGKVGDVHPVDSTLPPSHDVFGCFTGSSISDPASGYCYFRNNAYVYSGDTNVVLYPNSWRYDTINGQRFDQYGGSVRRNIWYSFVINGPGDVTVKLNGLNHKELGDPRNALYYSVYESDEDGSLSLAQLKTTGKIDSTTSQGLTYITRNRNNYRCWYPGSYEVGFTNSICDTLKPRRYYIVLASPHVFRHAWFEIKYDSNTTQIDTLKPKYDYFSQAGEIKTTDVNLITNGSFNSNLNSWSFPRLGWSSWQQNYYWTYAPYPEKYARSVRTPSGSNYSTMSQSIDLKEFANDIQSGANFTFNTMVKCFKDTVAFDEAAIEVKFYNSSGSVLDSQISVWVDDSIYTHLQISGTIPTSSVSAIVYLHVKNNGGDYTQAHFDDVKFSVTSSKAKYRSKVVYEGAKDYTHLATHDKTDQAVDAYGRCWNTRKTLWYKFKVDSSGYIYYNIKRKAYPTTDDIQTSASFINLYRYDESGDTINGLTHIRPISTTTPTTAMGRSDYACVSPGTYYFRVENCVRTSCLNFADYLYPRMMFNFHTGDFCDNAIPLVIDTLELVKGRALINCHTMGNDFGEDGSDLGCLQGPSGYKSTWFKVDYQDTTKIDLEFKLAEFTTAKAGDIRYRTYYGNCKSLTPAPCNNNALTSFVLDCLRKGTYYVQVVSPENATGELEMSVEALENKDSTCEPVDIFKPNAAFTYKTSCPENVVEFINTSSRGDSISYFWDFGYNNLTDTTLNPVVTYPPDGEEKSYNVKLIVQHRTRGSVDSLELSIDVPFAPDVRITSNDTLLCEGDSVKLEAYISHDTGYWHTGDTANSIWAKETGWYYFDMVDKPQLIEDESFETSFASSAWKTPGSGTWDRQSGYSPIQGSYSLNFRAPSAATTGLFEAYQDIDVSSDSLNIDSGISKNSVSGFVRGYLTTWAGYSSDNEAQIIIEYYDSSNTLLAQNASGLQEVSNNWDFIEFNRTTPKHTRTIRVRLQISKLNQSYDNAYIFFDLVTLKMRSSCNYLDSVYVQINKNPKVTLPNDTFFCKGDSIQLQSVVSYESPYWVLDSFKTTPTGTLFGNARYDSTNSAVQLTPASSYTNGQIQWVDSSFSNSSNIDVRYDLFIGEGGYPIYYTNYCYLFCSTRPTTYQTNSGGYQIAFRGDGARNNWMQIYYGSTQLHNVKVGRDFIGKGWQSIRINYNQGVFKIYVEGKLLTTYTDQTSRTQSGYLFGLGSNQYSWTRADVGVKNVSFSQNNSGRMVVPQPNAYSYTWSNGSSSANQWLFSTDTLSVKVEDVYGCESNWDTVVVEAVRQYDSLFTQEERVCSELDSFQLQLPVPDGYFYGTTTPDSAGLVRLSQAKYGNNEVYYAVIDTFGCLLKDTGNFIVDSVPEVEIVSAGPFCKNDSPQQLSVNDSNGYFYGGAFIDSSGLFNPALATAGNVKVFYETFGFGCTGLDSLIIQVDTIPDASITAAGPFCENGGMQSISPAVNTGGWFTNTTYIDSAGNFNPALATAGTHMVYYTFTDGNGCTDTDSTTILVDTIPDASITASGPFCENAGIQLLSGAVNTGGWFTNTSYLDSTGNFNPALATAGRHLIYYTFTDGNGCTDTDSTTILVDTIPDASITPAGPFCENGGLQTISPAVNTGGWFTNTTYIDSAGNFNPALATAGSHLIYYTFTDGNGCSETDSTTILVDTIPDASITAAGPFCENGGMQTISPAVNTGGWFTNTSYLDSAGNFNPALATAGSHLIYYTFTDGNGCTDTDSTTIIVDTIPDASITAAGPFCENGGMQTISPAVNTGGWFTNTTYLDSAGNFNPALATAGRHLIYYTFTDGNGCTDTDSTTILVDTIPDASITAAGPFCENGGMQIITPAVNTGGWFKNTAYIDSSGNFNPALATAGSHMVYYTFTDGNGCTDTDSTTILVDTIPDASITAAGPFCENGGVQTISPAVNTGGWFTNMSYLDSVGNFNPALATAGSHLIYYTYTDGNGCRETDSTTILVDTIPDASITVAGPFCENGGMQTLSGAVNTGGWFTNTTYIDSAGNFNPALATAGSHLIYYTFTDGNGCTDTDSTTILVDTIPDASITAAGPFCKNGGLQTISPAVNTGGWFTNTTYIDSAGNFNPALATAGSHLIYYTFTDGNGCSETDSTTILVDTIPDASITAVGPFCENGGMQIITPAVNTGGWFKNTAYIDSSGNFNPALATSGSHLIYYTFTDGNGCTDTDSTTIIVDTIPDASITAAGPFCENGGMQTISPAVNTGGWFTNTSYLDSAGNFNPALAAAGTHMVYYTFTDGNGCTDTDSTTIIVDTIPDASITAAGPFCENGGMQIITPAVNTGGWFKNTAYIDSSGNFNPALATSGSHLIYYTYTDGNGCTETDSTTILVDTIPDASITSAGPFCENGGVQTIIPAVNTGGWFTNTTYLDSAGNFDPALAAAGSHMVYYTFTDGKGCTDTDSTTIIVDTIPDASITAAGPFCENGGLQTISPAVNTGGWFTNTTYIDSAGNFNPALATAGSHTVYYTFTDGKGCTDTDSTTILVDTIPDASITAAGPFCENEGIQILEGAVNLGGLFTSTSYLDNAGNFNPELATPGDYVVYYTFTDGNGCAFTDSTTITVHPIEDPTISGPISLCINDEPIQFTSASTLGSFGGGSYINQAGLFTPQLASLGDNQVWYDVTNAFGCRTADTVEVEILDAPTNTISINPIEGCDPLEVTVSTESADSLIWNITGRIVYNEESITDSYGPGSYTVELRAKNGVGCQVLRDTSFVVHPNPVANFSYSPEEIFISNPRVQFEDLSTGTVVDWYWEFGNGFNSGQQNPDHLYSSGGEYNVVLFIEDENGCLDTAEQVLLVKDELLALVPNAFTPNGDGLNDVFRLSGVGIEEVSIKIYSRWGELIYANENFQQWDGKYKGEVVQNGVYVYILTIKDSRGYKTYRSGEVSVLR